ncbi:leucyl aminopeptidase family protein [Patescibacteria group bacterium]|nr:leucyl aminopeptidase family protein [Patescibacteria group bacterium]MBU1683374.1 leucyl aminopeptidase family protein [Patescibacteria group bacterium]MBU1934430.1 leucyl aminopeptidase family protein [Patescibacteria group bacterium]
MMTKQDILKLLDTKNQNLPKISTDSHFQKYERVNVLVFEGEEKDAIKQFPCLKGQKDLGKTKDLREIICGKQIFWIHGLGKREKITNREIRRIFGKIYLGALSGKPKRVVITCPGQWAELAALGIHVAALDPSIYKPKKKDDKKEPAPEVVLIMKANEEAKAGVAIKKGQITAEGKNLMRILGALPPNILSTEMYAEVIKSLAKQWKVNCKHVAKKDLKKYELLNAVSEGSGHDSQLLVLTIHPKKGKTKKSTALVGKGLCYDSGGLQGKQNYMKSMKEDMAGSASVLGTILNIVKNNIPLKETTYFLLPLAENMMGSAAMKADDVWMAGDGQTVEIIHTDAEGRLALADAICYAKNNFKDIYRFYTIATLTGSCIIALGEIYTGIVCNNEDLKKQIEEAGKESGDLVHGCPWDMEYDDNNSPVADIANLGEKDRDAGWIKAGLFLYRFVPKAKNEKDQAEFCHVDIAGSIDMKGAGRSWRRKGFSSGVGVCLLSELLGR